MSAVGITVMIPTGGPVHGEERRMRTTFRILAATAAASILTLGLAPGVAHAALPSDCTMAAAGTDGLALTCTARPPTQTWHIAIYCTYWTHPSVVAGNHVTGNGTSEAHCLLGYEPDGGFMVIDS
jgi:hypothetical protein